MKVSIMKKITIIVLIIFLFIPLVHSHSNHGELTESEIIKIAMSAAPLNLSEKATIIGSDGSILREGNNGWTCMPGTPPNENVNPMCVDKAWQKWLKAYMEQTPYNSENESFGTSYMLIGDQAVDNDDPFNLDKTKGTWIAEGPHLMLLLPESLMSNLPTNPYAGGPYVMWKGNEFVHVMVPLEVTSKP